MNIREFVSVFSEDSNSHSLSFNVTETDYELPTSIRFLESEADSAELPPSIYLCDKTLLPKLSKTDSTQIEESLFICHKRLIGEEDVFSLGTNINYLITDLSFGQLFNTLSAAIENISCNTIENAEVSSVFEKILDFSSATETIHEKIKALPQPLTESNFLFIFKARNGFGTSKHIFLSKLADILKSPNIGEYDGNVVVLLSDSESKIHLPTIQTNNDLLELLEEYDVCASISPSFEYVENIPILYSLMSEALTIKVEIPARTKQIKRIAVPQYYAPFIMASFCHKYCIEHLNIDAYAYLIHPGMVELLRYDYQHNTNLSELLFIYLINDKNVTITAEEMFMHKNTVLNKIKKIISIIDCDLDDPKERMHLMVSHLFSIYRKYMCNIEP